MFPPPNFVSQICNYFLLNNCFYIQKLESDPAKKISCLSSPKGLAPAPQLLSLIAHKTIKEHPFVS